MYVPPQLLRCSVWTCRFARLIQTYQLSPKGLWVGQRVVPFDAYSAVSRAVCICTAMIITIITAPCLIG